MTHRKTNWDKYYIEPVKLSKATRYLTGLFLINLIKRYVSSVQQLKVVELGGGGGAFYYPLNHAFQVGKYVVIDNNQVGLNLLSSQTNGRNNLELINADVLDSDFLSPPKINGDLVFSVGLIEHFSESQLSNAIEAHFACAADNGIVIIVYPTTTWLYRLSRWVAELCGWWAFPDETPLPNKKVAELVQQYGEILLQSTNWWTPFTQGVTVIRYSSK